MAFVFDATLKDAERLSGLYEGVRIMHQETAWDAAIDRGVVRGQLRQLLLQGRERFGDPVEKIVAELNAINDTDRLERMAIAILKVRSWKALLSVE
ncbi:MAG: hypothetical protein HYR84_01680 [Planctomycetes bacterium]|nr:hypothetical protein [Planctomycetota bacterium]